MMNHLRWQKKPGVRWDQLGFLCCLMLLMGIMGIPQINAVLVHTQATVKSILSDDDKDQAEIAAQEFYTNLQNSTYHRFVTKSGLEHQ